MDGPRAHAWQDGCLDGPRAHAWQDGCLDGPRARYAFQHIGPTGILNFSIILVQRIIYIFVFMIPACATG